MIKLLFKYIKQHIYVIILSAVYILIFNTVFFLYDIHTEAVLYASVLCISSGIILFSSGFIKFYKSYKERQSFMQNVMIITEDTPDAQTYAEQDYIDMIVRLKKQYQETETKYRMEQNENLDYYTTWIHQIKTPVSVMHMILQSEDTEESRELSAELFRIEQYADMALYYSRLGSDTSDFVFTRLPLDNIIRNSIRKFASQFIRRHIKLNYQPSELIILTDEKWLAFIMEQILSNALKYTENGSIMIYEENGILKIEDTGIGIAKEDLPRIFERGFTGYNGRANRKSTGLGLYLCKKASDKLLYKVWAESEIGKGSIFCIDLNRNEIEKE